MTFKPKKKKPPDLPLAVTLIRSITCFPLSSNCPGKYGFNHPCAALGGSVLGRYSNIVSSQWLLRVLSARFPPLNPDSLVFCDRLARTRLALCVLQPRGSRSAKVERRWHDWHIRSLRFDSFNLLCFRQIQVRSHLPLLFITVVLGTVRFLCLIVVWCILCGCSVYRIELPRFSWSWISLLSPCNICVTLNLDLPLDMVVDRRDFEIDSYGVLHLHIKVEGFAYASPVAYLFGYWSCCWNKLWARSYRGLCDTSCSQLWQPQYLGLLAVVFEASYVLYCPAYCFNAPGVPSISIYLIVSWPRSLFLDFLLAGLLVLQGCLGPIWLTMVYNTICMVPSSVFCVSFDYPLLFVSAGRMYFQHLFFFGQLFRGVIVCLGSLYFHSSLIPSLLIQILQGVFVLFCWIRCSVLIFDAGAVRWLGWVFPSLLLSLPLVVQFIQNIEPLAPYSCWYLDFQVHRDEVKGNCPFAYDEVLTEAMLACFCL